MIINCPVLAKISFRETYIAVADFRYVVMTDEGDISVTFTTTGQSALASDSVLSAESKLPAEAQSDVDTHSRDVHNDVADIVDDIISIVAAAEVSRCAMMTSTTSDRSDDESTQLSSSAVSASADDVQLVEMQLNGNYAYFIIYNWI